MADAAAPARVLIADDDLEMRRLVRRALAPLGVDIIEAHNGEEALEQLIVEQPDAMVLDVMMPVLSGWEILKYLREKPTLSHIKVLMLTGVGKTVNALTAPLYGADAYLDKPFDLDEVRSVVSGFVADIEAAAAAKGDAEA